MTDFSVFEQLDVQSDMTAKFKIHQVTINGKTPTIILAPATELNKPYFNAMLKRSASVSRAAKRGALTASMIDETRELDRELYPQFVAKGWDDMVDPSTGNDVPFSKTEFEALLANIPDWLFDDMRLFAGDNTNYTQGIDIEVTAKNSKSG